MRLAVIICLVSVVASFVAGCGKEDRVQAYLERGIALFDQGDLVKARLELKNVLQIEPKQPQAWFLLAQIHEQEEEWRPAFNAYSRTVELDPTNHQARVKRGALLLAGDRAEEALVEAETVLAAEPAHPGALALRGAGKAVQGDLEAGAADAETALAADPEQAEALALLADIRTRQGHARRDWRQPHALGQQHIHRPNPG